MRVLIIGGSRFIGLAVAQRLLIDGHRITLLNRGKTEDPFGTRVSRVLGDRSDPTTLQRAVARRDFDVAIDVISFREEDTRAAIDRLDGRIGHFIHVSTASVYLIRDGLHCPFREDDFPGRLTPKNEATASSWLYAYHKRRCEQALLQAWESRQFPSTSLRLPMVVGPGDYTERSLAYLERIADGGPLVLPDGGLNSWGFLWVEDVAEVIAANLMNAVTFGRAYNLAQREVVSVRQFVDAAAAAMARTPAVACVPSEWLQRMHVGTAFSPYSHDRDIVLDTQPARTDMLFEPTPFEEWCGRLVAHFRSTWDHTPSKHYATRPLELRIVQELAQLRIPAIAPVSVSR